MTDLGADESLATNSQRVAARETLIPEIKARLGAHTKAALVARLAEAGLPYAEVNTPEALFDDPHLVASGGLIPVTVPDGQSVPLPALPLALGQARPGLRHDIPTIGGDGHAVLRSIGYGDADITAMEEAGVLTVSEERR